MHIVEPPGRAAAAEPLPWSYAQQAVRPVPEPRVTAAQVARASLIALAVFAALGLLAGWVWARWAEPAGYVVTSHGAVMGELQAGQRFGVDADYSALAGAGGLLAGSLLGWRQGRLGWVQPVVVALAAGLAAVIAWRLGVTLGPPPPAQALKGAQLGDLVPEELDVHAKGLLLLWPIAALVGSLASAAAHRPASPPEEPVAG